MQPLQSGWYWDPEGTPHLFRWWDGRTWTPYLTVRPDSGPPPAAAALAEADGVIRGGGLVLPAPEDWRPCPVYAEAITGGMGRERVIGRAARGRYIAAILAGHAAESALTDPAPASVCRRVASDVLGTFYPEATILEERDVGTIDVGGAACAIIAVALDVHDTMLDPFTEDVIVLVRPADPPGLLVASLPRTAGIPSADEVLSSLALKGEAVHM